MEIFGESILVPGLGSLSPSSAALLGIGGFGPPLGDPATGAVEPHFVESGFMRILCSLRRFPDAFRLCNKKVE